MDLFNENRRRVNLGGSNRSSDSTSSSSSFGSSSAATASRAEVLEKARKEREARQKAKEREVAASKIQAFYRSRHSHQLLTGSRRKQWDVDLAELARAAQAGGKGITASAMSHCIASYFSFSVLTPRNTPKLLPTRSSPSRSQVLQADLTRFRHLVKLLLASYRQPSKEQHIGSMIIEGGISKSTPSTLSASASSWLFQMSRVSSLILEHIGSVSVASNSIEHVQNEIVLLWLILDANQWPFVKDVAQSTPEQKSFIQQVQLQLATRLTQRNPLDAKLASTTVAAATHSSSSVRSTKPLPSYQTRPSIDLLSCLRARLLDLTHLPKDGVATPAQLQQKTSVALLMATVIRVMTLYSFSSSPSAAHPLPTAFVFHILSIPLLPQRLKFMGLQALLPSLLAPTVFDRSLESLTFHVRALNQLGVSSSSSGHHTFTFSSFPASESSSIAFAFNRQNFHSVSSSWFDEASIVKTAAASTSSASASAVGTSSTMSDDDMNSPPRLYTYFTRGDSEEEDSAAKKKPKALSGLAWIMGNLLELVTLLDETKSAAASQSFSHFLAAIEQLIQAIPHAELPALAGEGGASSTLADHDNATNQLQRMPPAFTKQFAVFGERSFLDRLSRRLMADPNHAANMEDGNAATSSSAALNDIPIVCVLIDSILFKWTQSSNSILNTLVFSSDIVSKLWKAIKASGLVQRIDSAGKGSINANFTAFPTVGGAASSSSSSSSISSASGIITMEQIYHDRFFNLLPLFCTFFGHLLIVLDDEEFFVKQSPFNLQADIIPMVQMLKTLLYHLYWVHFTTMGTPARLRERFSKLFIQLRDRQSRKQFMSAEQWLFNTSTQNIPIEQLQSELMSEEELRRDLEASASEMQMEQGLISPSRASSIMASIPFVLPFADRVKLFYAHIAADKQRVRMGGIQFDHGLGKRIRVRRATILEDSFEAMNGLTGSQLKGRIQVEFVDEHGLNEAGVDGGGLWKEMLTTLLKKAFDPSYNLFSETQEHFIYPNPQALDLPLIPHEDGSMTDTDDPSAGEESKQILSYFYFLGAMIGKALYDGIQIETQFALFFLRYCVGLSNYLDDLAGLDPMLYQSLMKIKSFPRDQDLSELGLSFSVDKQVFGVNKTIDLIPNGRNITVTHENKVRFLYFMSDYYLNRQMSRQANAFSQGLVSIINRDWLRMFAAEEMRLLISGSQGVNIRDLAQFTNYASGYSANHEAIKWFWEILSEFDHEQVASLLRFTTSCSRAPLLGFAHLYPGFCIQRVNADANEQTLPTAATCMNLLRLPRYSTKDRMKEKLLYAITTASHGFGLT